METFAYKFYEDLLLNDISESSKNVTDKSNQDKSDQLYEPFPLSAAPGIAKYHNNTFISKQDSYQSIQEKLSNSYHHYLRKQTPHFKLKMYRVDENGWQNEEMVYSVKNQLPGQDQEKSAFAEDANVDMHMDVDQQNNLTVNKQSNSLLKVPIETLLQKISLASSGCQNKPYAQSMTQKKNSYISGKFSGDEEIKEEADENDEDIMEHNEKIRESIQNNKLWIDKYTSNKYLDLLTDEVTNRNVLTWLKSWDEVVFPQKSKVSLQVPQSMRNMPKKDFSGVNIRDIAYHPRRIDGLIGKRRKNWKNYKGDMGLGLPFSYQQSASILYSGSNYNQDQQNKNTGQTSNSKFPGQSSVKTSLNILTGQSSSSTFRAQKQFKKVDDKGKVYFTFADTEYSLHNSRVLLLYGPPGGGKSTMARVLARQCGYEPREINASDVRSGDALLDKIKNAMQMDSHFGKDSGAQGCKPTCLILDEVDGALGGGAGGNSDEKSKGLKMVADYLKKCILKAETTQSKKKGDYDSDEDMSDEDKQKNESKRSTKKKEEKDEVSPLKRPIIFICNEAYGKSMIPIKELALKVKVEGASESRLMKRLWEIVRAEDVLVTTQLLQTICSQSNYDSRSTINTLQFLSAAHKRTGERISHELLQQYNKSNQKSNMLQKDQFENIFTIASEILFDKPDPHVQNSQLLLQIISLLDSIGNDTQFVNNCLFENYNAVTSYYDDSMQNTAFFMDLMSRQDEQEVYINRTQNYQLKNMQFLAALAFKKFCAGVKKENVQYPRLFHQLRQDLNKHKYIFNQMLDLSLKNKKSYSSSNSNEDRYKLQGSVLQQCRKIELATDILPFVYLMIHPNVRDINTQLFNAFERENFKKAIEIMITLDIKLKSDSVYQQQQVVRLDGVKFDVGDNMHMVEVAQFMPQIDKLVCFGSSSQMYMRNQTQVLILQNYEIIKQQMLSSYLSKDQQQSSSSNSSSSQEYSQNSSSNKNGIKFEQSDKLVTESTSKKASNITGFGKTQNNIKEGFSRFGQLRSRPQENSLTPFGIFAQVQQQNTNKKRRLDQISRGATDKGKFLYKFKEGHSKNFKRELFFDYFMTNAI